MPVIDRTSGVPAYRQVADHIRAQIDTGEYPPGAKLPSERDLVESYGVSRPTIRDAIGLLRAEGVVIAEHGRGVFVRPTGGLVRLSRLSRAARQANRSAFLGDAAAGGFTATVRVKIYFDSADDRAAELLGVEPGTELCVRDRVMSADGVAVQLAVSRLPRTITKGTAIEHEDTGVGGVHSRLEEAGYPVGHFTETVGARMPTPVESSALQITSGTPILTVTRVAYAMDDTPLEVNDIVLAADRYELAYDIPAE